MLLKGIFIPIAVRASRAHRAIAVHAPSNCFILILWEHSRRLNAVVYAVVASGGCIATAHLLTQASGAPGRGWLVLASLCLAWDALKFLATAIRLTHSGLSRSSVRI